MNDTVFLKFSPDHDFGINSFDRISYSLDRLLINSLLAEGEYESERCSYFPFGFKVDVPSKLLDNLLRNVKAKTDSLGIKLLSLLQKAKQLEQFAFVLILDSYAIVGDRNLDHSM